MKKIGENSRKNIYKLICSIFLCAALILDLSMMGKVISTDTPWDSIGSLLLGLALICLGLYELVFFIYKIKRTGDKLYYANLAYSIVFIIIGILVCVLGQSTYWFGLLGIIFLLVPIAKAAISIVRNHRIRNIIGRIILVLIVFVFLGVNAVFIGQEDALAYATSGIMPGTILAVICLVNICVIAFSNFNKGTLRKIIHKTYAGEVIFGLLLLVVAFAMVLMMVEPEIKTYWDALWYCFMLVTTIGFGDITSTSVLGRVLSVFLGIYGIVVVSIVTSVIVNFYNEVKNDKDEDEEQESVEENKEEETIVEETEQDNQVETKEDEKVAE